MDMTPTIIPKSDQINSDDLIAGPRTITVTRVTANESTPEQPVNVFFDGDNGKPFRPCKSMRRVMVSVWGADAAQYAGRAMTIYRDPEVMWGGMKVGGIRISHMSHIDRDQVLVLTASKSNRKPCTIKPLKQAAAPAKAAAKVEAPPPIDDDVLMVDYISTTGEAELIDIDTAIRKLRAAHKAPQSKLSNADWFKLYKANEPWIEERAPEVAAELSLRA